jgi:putative transposase
MIRTYRYRLYPTSDQIAVLTEIFDLARWLYNHALAYRRKRWQESRLGVTYGEQCVMWKHWRNEQPQDNLLRLLNMSAGQRVLRRLDNSYRQFLKGKRGKPRFKGKRSFSSVSFTYGDGTTLKNERLYVQNVGLINVKWHRPLISGDVKAVVVKRKATGWYVLLQIECADLTPQPSEKPSVGVDVGIHHALALSNGQVIDSPQYLRQLLKHLRVLQRTVARRKKGSKRREKAIHQLARVIEHIANQRRDWWHRVIYHLVKEFGVIVLEDLNLQFMLRNKNMARAAHDVSLGLFYEILNYKAFDAGVQVVRVNPRNTSQNCNGCGMKVEKALSVRVHQCPHCSFTADRDVNAALNILALGFSPI